MNLQVNNVKKSLSGDYKRRHPVISEKSVIKKVSGKSITPNDCDQNRDF
jgi:hypothetical protein